MSSISKRIFPLAALLVIIAGAIAVALYTVEEDWGMVMIINGAIFIISGLLMLISGVMTPTVSESSRGRILGAILLVGAAVALTGLATMYYTFGSLLLGGGILIFIVCLAWPCVCLQGGKGARSQIIGVASAHDSIAVPEISRITGLQEKTVRDTLYDAIGKRQLHGKMEGDTFVRSVTPTHTYAAPATTTREREVVKVLVICPFCGAKTEQGLSKCQNCGGDL